MEDSEVGELLFSLNMWFYSFLLKLLPCVVLIIFTGWLIQAMYQVGTRLLESFFFIYKSITVDKLLSTVDSSRITWEFTTFVAKLSQAPAPAGRAELALFSYNPSTYPHPHPPTPTRESLFLTQHAFNLAHNNSANHPAQAS